jgi:hypothetical protein
MGALILSISVFLILIVVVCGHITEESEQVISEELEKVLSEKAE